MNLIPADLFLALHWLTVAIFISLFHTVPCTPQGSMFKGWKKFSLH